MVIVHSRNLASNNLVNKTCSCCKIGAVVGVIVIIRDVIERALVSTSEYLSVVVVIMIVTVVVQIIVILHNNLLTTVANSSPVEFHCTSW